MWSIETEPEIEEWLTGLTNTEFARITPHLERLAERGNNLRMPVSRSLGDGLFELRFDLGRRAMRITYYFAQDRRIVLLTIFHKQRQNERNEVRRAHSAKAVCINEKHTAEEAN